MRARRPDAGPAEARTVANAGPSEAGAAAHVPPQRPDAPVAHVSRLRVYYEDTDAGGIVYHANYLRFFERARSDWLRALGVTHDALAARDGIAFVVRDAGIDWLRPARLDDELDVDVRVLETGRASMRVAQHAHRAPDTVLLARATVRVAAIDRASGRPAALPKWLYQRLTEPTAQPDEL